MLKQLKNFLTKKFLERVLDKPIPPLILPRDVHTPEDRVKYILKKNGPNFVNNMWIDASMTVKETEETVDGMLESGELKVVKEHSIRGMELVDLAKH